MQPRLAVAGVIVLALVWSLSVLRHPSVAPCRKNTPSVRELVQEAKRPAPCTEKVKTNYGFSVSVYCKSVDAFISQSTKEDTWPTRRVALFINNSINSLKAANPGRQVIALDIGTNIGFFSVLMASRGAQVTSFEALPMNAAIARKNIEDNNLTESITLIPAAVSSEDGYATLSQADNSPGATSLANKLEGVPWKMHESGVTARTVRAKEVLDMMGITRVDMLKIDVEGHEYQALQGLGSLRKLGIQYISLEYMAPLLEANGVNPPEKLLEYIWDQGFKTYHVKWSTDGGKTGAEPESITADNIKAMVDSNAGHFDFFAVAPS